MEGNRSYSYDQIQLLRTHSQGLYPATTQSSASVRQLVQKLVGVQAQEPRSAELTLWARSQGLLAADVEIARTQERSIVRTWAMRGTLHLVATDDIGWLIPLIGPGLVRKSRRRFAQLGLDESAWEKAREGIQEALSAQSTLTRYELGEELSGRGVPTEGQAIYHLLRRAGLEGLICYGPIQSGQETYVLLKDWIGSVDGEVDPESSAAELAHRYLVAYGPAGTEDMAAWSGLSIREVRAGFASLQSDLVEVDGEGSRLWMLRDQIGLIDELDVEPAAVSLLPGYDPYLLGYASREWVVTLDHAKRVHPGGGVLRPTVIVAGAAVGVWKIHRRSGSIEVGVGSFDDLGDEIWRAVKSRVDDLGRFLGVDAKLRGGSSAVSA